MGFYGPSNLDDDPSISGAIAQIFDVYGVQVSVGKKTKALLKFGRNTNLSKDVAETVWETGGTELYAEGNDIKFVKSSSGEDTQKVVIEGHTLNEAETALTFVTQEATLKGAEAVELKTPLYRCNRLYNNGATDFTGTVTVYRTYTEGEEEKEAVHVTATGAQNQSLKCATSLSSTDFWIVTGIFAGVRYKKEASVNFEFQVREFGKTFRTLKPLNASSPGTNTVELLDPPMIVPANADFRMTATSSIAEAEATASVNGHLAEVV